MYFSTIQQRGDVSGFVEGYVAAHPPLLTLHHLPLDLTLMPGTTNQHAAAAMLRAHAAAPSSFLTRLVSRPTHNVTIVLTVGYSVQVVPANVSDAALARTEVTMRPWRLPFWEHGHSEGYHFPTRHVQPNTTRFFFQDALREPVPMHVYANEHRHIVVVACGGCDAPGGLCATRQGGGWTLRVPAVRCQ